MNSSPNTERVRLARELHDGLAQELAAVGYRLDQVIGDTQLDHKNRRSLRELRLTLSGVINQVRDEIFELRSNTNKSLDQQIEEQIATVLAGTDITYEISNTDQLECSNKFELLRAIREILINARAHSGCTEIKIEIADKQITILDNGSGGVTQKSNSFGLIGVSERLALIDARLEISSLQSGTAVRILF
jgi:signal transduction histidine kinase